MEGIISDVDTVRQRLTPAHIGLFSYVPKKPATSFDKAKTQYSKDKGTHCVAKQTIGRGDILIREQPFIRQLDRDHLKDHCSWCFAHFDLVYMDDLYFCRNEEDCNWFAQYCSPRCEQASWNAGHCIMCRFPELEWLDRNTLFALTGYIASLSHGQGSLFFLLYIEMTRTLTFIRLTDKIPGLVSNMELETESRINKLKQQFKMVAELFYLNDKAIEKLVEIYLQIKCNTFTVKAIEDLEDYGYVVSRDYTNLGKAVYLSASKLNHSCDPNALVSFGEVQNVCELKIQCIKGPVKEGQEVTISYGPLATKMKKEERRKLLKDNYYFDCQCSACDETNENSPDKIYKCQICKSGKLYRQQTACNECGQEPHWPFFLKVSRVYYSNEVMDVYFTIASC